MCADREPTDPDPETATFSRALASLRAEGSNLLIVGEAHDTARSQACQRFVGEPGGDPRRRLFVRTEPSGIATDVMRESYTQTGPESTKVVEQVNQFRSAAAETSTSASASLIPRTTVPGGDLSALGETILSGIDAFEAATGGLDPAEFRLCFDSLRPLFADHDDEAVFRFLHTVTASVKDVAGMAHYHLPVPRDSETVDLIAPLFDAVVEVRIEDSYPQQRWELRDEGVTTDWLSL